MRLACLLLLAGCMRAPDAAAGLGTGPGDTGRLLTVIGTGRLLAAPTRVDVDAIVITASPGPELAWQQGADRMAKLMRQVATCGIPAEDMAVNEGRLERSGGTYRLEQRLRITVRDLKLVPPVLANALGAGAERVEGARYSLDDGRAAGDRARERALLDAQDKAQMLAQELRLRLGPVRSVEELPESSPTQGPALDYAPGALEAVSELRVTNLLLD